ncbi:MAG: flagellar biosynthetic protein FliO [Cellulosilyticaceae bacterium]
MPSQSLGVLLELLFLIIVFSGVLYLAYLVTRKLAQVKQGGVPHKHMKVVEYLGLGQGQTLCIVKIGKDYHVIGMTKEHIEYCFKLEDDALQFENIEVGQFQNYLTQWIKGKQEKEDEKAK